MRNLTLPGLAHKRGCKKRSQDPTQIKTSVLRVLRTRSKWQWSNENQKNSLKDAATVKLRMSSESYYFNELTQIIIFEERGIFVDSYWWTHPETRFHCRFKASLYQKWVWLTAHNQHFNIWKILFLWANTPYSCLSQQKRFSWKRYDHCLINAIHCGFQNHFISFLFYEYFSIEWSRRSSSDVYKCRLATVGRCGHRVVEIKMIINSGPHTLQS